MRKSKQLKENIFYSNLEVKREKAGKKIIICSNDTLVVVEVENKIFHFHPVIYNF